MEFYLIKTEMVELTGVGIKSDCNVTKVSGLMEVKIEPVVENSPAAKKYCDLLINYLASDKSWDFKECAKLGTFISLSPDGKGSIQVGLKDNYSNNLGVNIFHRILLLLGENIDLEEDGIKINLKVEDLHCIPRVTDNAFSFQIRGLDTIEDTDGSYALVLENERAVDFPPALWAPWQEGKAFCCDLTVTVSLGDTAYCNLLTKDFFDKQDLRVQHRNILKDAISTKDLVLVPERGKGVPCHRIYLAGTSPIFRDMFKGKMKVNSVTMPNMSEASVRAFLAFIYYRDVTGPSASFEVAFQMFQASYKCQVQILKDFMPDFVCAKPSEWFGVDGAVKLLLFANKLEEGEGDSVKEKMMEKGVRVLKWYTRSAPNEILASKEHQWLYKNNSKLAMELGILFLKYS